jgi:uncharacterized protein
MFIKFIPDTLKEMLTGIDKDLQLAFAASCAERILPNYEKFCEVTNWGDLSPLRDSLDLIWEACMGKILSLHDIETAMKLCEAVIPDSNDFKSFYSTLAQDAVFSIWNLMDYLKDGNIDSLISGARYTTDSIDLYVQEIENITITDPQREDKILHHPMMQQELARQQRNLRIVRESVSKHETIKLLRERALQEKAFDV